MARRQCGGMQTRFVDGITIRPLANGDTQTIETLFERLGDESRRHRFGGPKPRLAGAELARLARVDGANHALVAYVEGDPLPAGIARLARDGATAEVAFAVADEHQRRGIGRVLVRELAADARAAGIRELHAFVMGDNPPAIALMRGGEAQWHGAELELVVGL